jgi:hypothetical protein
MNEIIIIFPPYRPHIESDFSKWNYYFLGSLKMLSALTLAKMAPCWYQYISHFNDYCY